MRNIKLTAFLGGFFAVLLAPIAHSETAEVCAERWKAADLDANGALEAGRDNTGYLKAAGTERRLSREEFLRRCADDAFAAYERPNNPAANRDFGKGDITPGTPLNRDHARRRLEALGYRDVTGLKVDAEGVWRGQTTVGGRTVDVAIDAQGDVISK